MIIRMNVSLSKDDKPHFILVGNGTKNMADERDDREMKAEALAELLLSRLSVGVREEFVKKIVEFHNNPTNIKPREKWRHSLEHYTE